MSGPVQENGPMESSTFHYLEISDRKVKFIANQAIHILKCAVRVSQSKPINSRLSLHTIQKAVVIMKSLWKPRNLADGAAVQPTLST
jgi:hypothetical protein